MSVNNLAIHLAVNGRRAEALAAAQEATDFYRQSQQIHGDVYADNVSDAERLVGSLTDTIGEVDDDDRPSDP